MTILLFDTIARKNLYPLTATRAVADLRMGLYTMRQRWQMCTGFAVEILTDDYLQPLYGAPGPKTYLLIDASVVPTLELVNEALRLQPGEAISDEDGLLMGLLLNGVVPAYGSELLQLFTKIKTTLPVQRLRFPRQLFQWNGAVIATDFALQKERSAPLNFNGLHMKNAEQIFIHPEAQIEHCSLNATDGPIYIGKNALIMEGCLVRGPFAMLEGAVLKMGAKVYGGTTIGPFCVAGGEIKNSILMGYSNKAHDGYLGDSIVGEWCNLGAGTSNSNLKNNAGPVTVWNEATTQWENAGNKCGLIMGDYSRAAISTSFNTGTVVGVCCNVFDQQLTPPFIPHFSWGANGEVRYAFDKALRDIENWMNLKNVVLQHTAIPILKHIFDQGSTNPA